MKDFIIDEFEKSVVEKISLLKTLPKWLRQICRNNVRYFSHVQYVEVMLLFIWKKKQHIRSALIAVYASSNDSLLYSIKTRRRCVPQCIPMYRVAIANEICLFAQIREHSYLFFFGSNT